MNVSNGEKVELFKGARVRYPFHSHEVRDTLVTLARSTGADIVAANFFVGHTIDKLRYDKSPWNDVPYFRVMILDETCPPINPHHKRFGKVRRIFSQSSPAFQSND